MARFCKALSCLVLLLLCACQTELYTNLTEEQANEMLSVLLKRGIVAEKKSIGKSGYEISVHEKQIIRALQILHEHSLPHEQYSSLGTVFPGGAMISSLQEEKARMTYALSQELANTFSRIDGVLTSRVHVVLAVNDPLNNVSIPAQATVFLRHTPDSIVTTLVTDIRKACAGAVAGLDYEHVNVLLVPVRMAVTVPQAPPPPATLWGESFSLPLLLQTVALALFFSACGIAAFVLFGRFKKKKAEQKAASEDGES